MLTAALALLALGCGSEGGQADAAAPPQVAVELHRVVPPLLLDVEIFPGQLDAEHSVMLKSETEGVIASIEFVEGHRVEERAVLFRLRDAEQRARLAEAQAHLSFARANFDRVQKLVTRDAASLAQRDLATAELAVAEAQVDLAQVELDRTEIRAPFEGVVGARQVSPGDRVTDEIPLVQIDAVDRLRLTFLMSEKGLRFARVGAPVHVTVSPFPGEKFPGEVFFVSPTLNPNNRRIALKAWVPNADGRLRAGLFADAEFELGRREDALLVPESSVGFDSEHGSHVWRFVAGAAERAPVELGLRRNGFVEVVHGLRAGDSVVSAGTHKIYYDGTPLVDVAKIAEKKAEPAPPPVGAGGDET